MCETLCTEELQRKAKTYAEHVKKTLTETYLTIEDLGKKDTDGADDDDPVTFNL